MATSPSGSPDKDVARAIEDPFLRRSVMTALHLRRYLPFYVFGTIWIVTLSVFPSIRGADDDSSGLAATSGFDDGATLDAGAGAGEGALDTAGGASIEGAATAGTPAGSGDATGSTTAGGPRSGPAATKGAAAAPGARRAAWSSSKESPRR